MGRLDGRVALVTGAGRGFGRAIALALGRAGADLAVNYNVSAAAAKEVVAEVEAAGRRAEAVRADVAHEDQVRAMIARHVRYTSSDRGHYILKLWEDMVPKFVKVMPKDFKRVLTALKKANQSGLSGDEAFTAAFEENARDVARIGGG